MKVAPNLLNEKARLQTLLDYSILDTAPELEFDDITLLASIICNTPIALVSLIDENRQWFKSCVGLAAKETPRDVSFCGHAIEQSDLFVINDAFKDPRFSDNPLVIGQPNVRFYAGAPIISPSGHAVGTLCVIDHEPRVLSEEQQKSLKALSRQVLGQMELRKLNKSLLLSFNELKERSKLISSYHDQIIHSARLSSLGEMAGGIAHEINNPLAIISGKMIKLKQLIATKSENQKEVLEVLEKMDATIFRISKIIKGLLSFSREGSNDPTEKIKLQNIITDTVSLVSEKFKKSNIIFVYPEDTTLSVQCRAVQISQVLLNVLSNAFDAVEKDPVKQIKIEVSTSPEYAILLVSNSGHRISAEIQSRIMEPFFTTKEVGKGTGLGLSISKGLMESNHGSLTYLPECQETTFEIKIPL